jgi:hypothetical protein
MSLETRYRTEIVIPRTQLVALHGNFLDTPCGDLLRRALEKVAREEGGYLSESYADAAGRSHPAVLAIRTPECPLGIGVDVEADGRVVFRFDERGPGAATARRLCAAVTQIYAVLAVVRAQAQHGFQVSVEERQAGDSRHVVVRGVMA